MSKFAEKKFKKKKSHFYAYDYFTNNPTLKTLHPDDETASGFFGGWVIKPHGQ